MGSKKEQKEKKEKPLDKWTVKELREEALKIPGVQGVHGMNKDELISALKAEKGIVDDVPKKAGQSMRELKARLAQMREARDQEREQGATRARLNVLRKRLSRMKKVVRRAG
jgi:hypothetical protein